MRRLACPSLAAPMPTGDGLLARLPPLAEPMTPAMLAALASMARAHGNGRVEISKRGNLQLRGLRTPETGALAAGLAEAGFDLADGLPISLDPLAALSGLEKAGRAMVDQIHEAIASSGLAARLAPKLSIALDLGTPLAPRGLAADIRLALRTDRVHIALGGTANDATPLGWTAAGAAPAAVIALLAFLAGHGPEARFGGRSGLAGDPALAAIAGLTPGAPPERADVAQTVGPVTGLAAAVHGIAFPFGQALADDLDALAGFAAEAGLAALAPAADHALLLAGPPPAVAATVTRAAALGLITDPRDPRRFVSACAGSEGCLSGHFPARRLAAAWTAPLAPLLDGSLALHVSGCRKGCAHPGVAAFTIAGIDKGAALVLDGRARDASAGIGSPDDLAARLQRIADRVAARPAGETARAAIARLGLAGIVAAAEPEAL